MKYLLLFLLWIKIFTLAAQTEDLSQVWPAKWIMAADGPAREYAVHHFRKSFDLEQVPGSLIVHTSGDNRYQLFVNGKMVTWGPLRGDLRHWYYESTDIAPYLSTGRNVIAAVVLNYGSHPPDAQLSVQTGFLLTSNDIKYRFLNTGAGWKAIHNSAYSPSMVDKSQVNGYYGAGSKEVVDGNLYRWNWQQPNFDDHNWADAREIENAYAKTCKWASRWKLTPRQLKHEALSPVRFTSLRLSENVKVPTAFPAEAVAFEIPVHTRARFVLDQGYEITAYPVLQLSGGKNAEIKFTFVEAPYIGSSRDKEKGNRNEVEGKNFIGVNDRFIADGGDNRVFQPLWWRAYRYIEVSVTTFDQPLIIEDISGIRSVYPFQQKATFSVTDRQGQIDPVKINQIREIGHRTMLACSHEHFMDCPYYEESQFEGDTRVAALISYYNYGDPALGKNAIDQFSWSINNEGFLSARYPTNSLYYIPNFSLYWIGMLYDYFMLYQDTDFIKEKLPVMRMILEYFSRHEREDGTIQKLDYHQFVDWSFPAGEPPFDQDYNSLIVDLHYLMALQWAVQLEQAVGETYWNDFYDKKAAKIATAVYKKYWNEEIGLFTDLPGDTTKLSQHANCLAILTGLVEKETARQLMEKILVHPEMTQAAIYWKFYLFEALHKAGLGDRYLDQLNVWHQLIDLGVTTWPETGPNSRSECHAWGSSPNYHFLKITAGITPTAPGFRKIRIEPRFGKANTLEATMPHHSGEIEIRLGKNQKTVEGEIVLPAGTSGTFWWYGKSLALKGGLNKVRMK